MALAGSRAPRGLAHASRPAARAAGSRSRRPGRRAARPGPAVPGGAGHPALRRRPATAARPGPTASPACCARLDDAGIGGTLTLASSEQAAAARRARARRCSPTPGTPRSRVCPSDWSDLLCELTLLSTDYVERAAVLCIQMNPRRDGDRAALRFRCARVARLRRRAGDGPPLPRALPTREDIRGSVTVLRALSDTQHVGDAGPGLAARRADRLMADPVSWLLIEPGWEVVDADGERIGKVDEVLGEREADIWDGLTVDGKYVPPSRSADRRGSHHTRALTDALALAAQVRAGDVSRARARRGRDRAHRGDEPRAELPRHRLLRAGARGRRRADGPFTGVPMLVKDLNETAGVRTTFSSRAFADYVPTTDAAVVRRMKRGRLRRDRQERTRRSSGSPRVTESELNGACRNPWDTSRTPGGSSGGAAAAVAAGVLPLAHGSDGGGSIRIPAVVLRPLRDQAVARARLARAVSSAARSSCRRAGRSRSPCATRRRSST